MTSFMRSKKGMSTRTSTDELSIPGITEAESPTALRNEIQEELTAVSLSSPTALHTKRFSGRLYVTLHRAVNLAAGDRDPYVKLELRPVPGLAKEAKKTFRVVERVSKVKHNTLDPVWEEKFMYPIKTAGGCYLHCEVYDKDRAVSDDFLGVVEIPLEAVKNASEVALAPYHLKAPANYKGSIPISGFIELTLRYEPFVEVPYVKAMIMDVSSCRHKPQEVTKLSVRLGSSFTYNTNVNSTSVQCARHGYANWNEWLSVDVDVPNLEREVVAVDVLKHHTSALTRKKTSTVIAQVILPLSTITMAQHTHPAEEFPPSLTQYYPLTTLKGDPIGQIYLSLGYMGPDPHEAEERKMRASEAKRMEDKAAATRSRALVLDEVAAQSEQEAAREAAAAEAARRKQSMEVAAA
eukprot:CAMPEP_0198217220 /NCGR_PEP_ID=MMETSP1445-20131203/62279_1 /TAXON_ID=36898 /ORGANISM="Pyramimonas sp., Strain CCMP2087" /LENGTH=407 /DNA_ID=CAMNT_0043893803 /DNA_START=144 /DNA_END=1363 /DNA_ORIENTATION=-